MGTVRDFRDLDVYRRAYAAAREVCNMTRRIPVEERFALADQALRSSRSVCANIAEAWRKRRYPASFASKLSDADSEAGETTVWLDFAHEDGFASAAEHHRLLETYDHIQRQLCRMMDAPQQWCRDAAARTQRRPPRPT